MPDLSGLGGEEAGEEGDDEDMPDLEEEGEGEAKGAKIQEVS